MDEVCDGFAVKRGFKYPASMRFRTMKVDELETVARLSPEGDEFLGRLASLWEWGDSAPETCLVLEENDLVIAAAPFWSLASLPADAMLLDLLADWGNNAGQAAARGLLEHCFQRLRRQGIRRIETRLFSDISHSIYEKKRLYPLCGLPLIQEKESWQWNRSPFVSLTREPEITSCRLSESSIEEFREMLQKVSSETLDRYELGHLKREGPQKHAEDLLAALSDIQLNEELWALYYLKDQTPLGLAVRQSLEGGTGVVNYFGVVPQLRGRGYGSAILLDSVKTLDSHGSEQIIVDADLENFPLIRMLNRHGFQPVNRIWVFRASLV